MLRYLLRILPILIILILTSCSSGKSNPIVVPSDEPASGYDLAESSGLASDINIPFSFNPLDETRTAAGSNIGAIIENLSYDINAGWASFDLSITNSGAAIFDLYVNIEQIKPSGNLLVDGSITLRLKYGILARGAKSSGHHIEITFQPGEIPILSGFLEGSSTPMFQNERTLLHTDKFADHAHGYSTFSGRIIADQVLVRFRENISLSDQYRILDNYNLIPVGVNLSNGFIQADILTDRNPDDVVNDLLLDNSIDHAEVNTINFITHYPDDPNFNPADPAWGEDGINSWGQRRIQAPEAWDFYNDRSLDESGDVDVAYDTNAPIIMFICDTGYKYHEDLGIDAEDEAFLDLGLNIVDPEEFPYDDHGHGTLISGIAMAEGNNQTGMAGMAWNARIVPIKTNDYAGMGDEFRSGIAISYAKEVALDYPEYRCVGNMSYGTHSQQPEIDRVNEGSAFEDAWPVQNLQFVAAVGNCGNHPNPDPEHPCHYNFSLSADNFYPSSFRWPIAVAASKEPLLEGLDQAAGFSNWGVTVDVSAPGTNIYSSWKDSASSYRRASGTSCSSPLVSGLFALIWSRNPSLTKVEVRQIIRNTAEPMYLYPARVGKMGTGRINAYKALFAAEYLKPPVGEKVCAGDFDNDDLDETALGLNGPLRNTGMMLVFDRFGNELTNKDLKFDINTIITDAVFADVDGDKRDEIIASVIIHPGGLFTIEWPSNVVNIQSIKYEGGEFISTAYYAFFEDGTTTEHIAAGDCDGDSACEIVVALQTSPAGYFAIDSPANTLSIEIINQDSSILASIPVGSDMQATALTMSDIDDDSLDEIILAYIDDPAGVFAIDGGTNTGKLLILDDADSGFAEITTDYIPQSDRIIEQVLAVNLDDDNSLEIVISTLDYPSGYFENTSIQNDAALIAFDDAKTGVNEIARLEFDDIRTTFELTEGNIHPGEDDSFWAWFTLNPIGVDYVSGDPGGQLLMVPYGIDNGEIVQRGEIANSANGYRHFSGCVRNGDLDRPDDERNETALYAIEGGRFFSERSYEYHDDTGSNIYITWEYNFPPFLNFFENYKEYLGDTPMNPIEP